MTLTKQTKTTLALIFLFATLSAIYNSYLPLYLDEAYYWLWTKHLDIGYMDHPFMVALLIKLTTFASDTTFNIRLVTVFCFTVASIFVYLTAKRAFDEKTAYISVLIFLTSPAVSMGFTITSPDSPLIMFWSIALYFSYIAIFEKQLNAYILAGIAIGLALSSKYTAILLLGFVGIFLLIKKPKELASAPAWISVFFAFLFFSPTIYWNYSHDWLSFKFQFNHGTTQDFGIKWGSFFEFFGGLFLIFGPLFFGLFLYKLFRVRDWFRDEKLLFFTLSGLVVILFFLYKGLFTKMQLNWVAPAFIGLCIFLANFFANLDNKRLLIAALIVSTILSIVVRFPAYVGLKGEQNFHSRIHGFQELSEEVKKLALQDDRIYADHLTLASILTFYMQEYHEAQIPTKSRRSMFDEWQKNTVFGSEHGLYISDGDKSQELKSIWKNAELIEIFQTSSAEFKKKKFYIYRVYP